MCDIRQGIANFDRQKLVIISNISRTGQSENAYLALKIGLVILTFVLFIGLTVRNPW